MERTFLKENPISCFADEIGESMDEQIALLEELGISWIEFRSGDGKGVVDYTLDEARALKKKLDEHHIGISAIGSPLGKILITDDFEAHMRQLVHIADLADVLETRFIRMFSFYIPAGKDAEDYRDEVFSRLQEMKSYATERGLVLLHENEKGIYGDTAERCLKLMEALSDDHFRCTFDFANFIQCGQDTLEAFELLKSYIGYVHVKDAIREDGSVVPAGEGSGHIPDILVKLDQTGYSGFLSLEPHLADFAGLQGLELGGASRRERTDQTNAFCQAYRALEKILYKKEEEK